MSSFDDREKSFEKKFAHDEELQFKISARKNKYLAQWASKILGYNEEKEKDTVIYKIKNNDVTKKVTNWFKKKLWTQ